jgi:sec-independent protein translocase protein TatA
MLSSVFLFLNFSASEIMFILFVALILFGGDKFPEIARGLAKGIREFKEMSDGVKREIHSQINSYEANPNRDNEIKTAVPPPVEAPQETVSAPPEIAATPHEPISSHEPVTAPQEPAPAVHEPVEAPQPQKPNLTQPPNTISHQSY